MGLAASQARFLSLTQRKSDIEFQGQQTNQERTLNAYNMQALVADLTAAMAGNEITDVSDPAYLTFEAEIERLHAIDRTLELELKDLDTQHNETQTEIDAVKKVIDKNIEMTFKTFA
jgi:hypothetical protein